MIFNSSDRVNYENQKYQPKKMPKNLKTSLLVIYLITLIIHFVIKDRWSLTGTIFYASPLSLLIGFGIVLCLLFFKKKLIFYLLLLSLIFNIGYFFNNYFGTVTQELSSNKTTTIAFWNVAKKQPLPTNILISHIKSSSVKIVALVEAVDVSDHDLNELKMALPSYHIQILEGNMLLIVQGSVNDVIFESVSEEYKYNVINATVDHSLINIMIPDVYASPFSDKESPLTSILQATDRYNIDILMGDFNTPYESIFFKDYKEKYNSFHNCSIGLTSTWPVPIPVLEIDQIWISRALQSLQMKKFQYKDSDHKLLIATYLN